MSGAFKPTFALAKIVWRHSPVGWVALAFIPLLLWLPVGALVHRHFGAGRPPMVWRYEFALGWAFVGGCVIWLASVLAGAALDRLRSRAGLQLIPALGRHLHRLLWLAFALFWLLAGAPGALLAGPGGLWWALPWSLGAVAGAMSLGTSVMVLGARVRWFGLAVFVFAFSNGLWRPLLVDAMNLATVEPATLQAAAAGTGALLFALWMGMARRIARRCSTAGSAANDWPQFILDRQRHMLAPTQEVLAARDPRWLVMPATTAMARRVFGGLMLNAAVLFVLARAIAPTSFALALLPLFVFLSAWGAAPVLSGAWVSPRALLLPRCERRQGLALRLFRQALSRALPPAAVQASVAAAALCLGSELGSSYAVIWVLAALASLPFTVAAALAAAAWGRSQSERGLWTITACTAFLVLLALAGHFGFGLPFVAAPAPWRWALLSLALSATLAAAWMTLIARPWARLDWVRMPASPVQKIR